MKSGMLAAETIVDALSENNFSDEKYNQTSGYVGFTPQ